MFRLFAKAFSGILKSRVAGTVKSATDATGVSIGKIKIVVPVKIENSNHTLAAQAIESVANRAIDEKLEPIFRNVVDIELDIEVK